MHNLSPEQKKAKAFLLKIKDALLKSCAQRFSVCGHLRFGRETLLKLGKYWGAVGHRMRLTMTSARAMFESLCAIVHPSVRKVLRGESSGRVVEKS